MRWGTKKAKRDSPLTPISSSPLPTHIAIIMDGNGRWAEGRGLTRIRGHHEGAKRVDEIVTECAEIGIKYLTLYTFSTENWNRPVSEVNLLMRLLVEKLKTMDKKLLNNGVQLTAQGTLSRLPSYVQKELNRVIQMTAVASPKLQLSLALSYGGRQEILDAVSKIASDIEQRKLQASEISEEKFQEYLYHPHFPDPDLLIRTGGESRVSNFLLWEIAYSEILVMDDYWPDFKSPLLHQAISEFHKRQRRFGKTSHQIKSQTHFSPVIPA